MLKRIQRLLSELYDLSPSADVEHFVCGKELVRATVGDSAEHRGEVLLVMEDEAGIHVGLYLDPEVLAALEADPDYQPDRVEPFRALCLATEGVSHFLYLGFRADNDEQVSQLELELQAEVDKYVLAAWLLREQGAGRFPRELHRALFERARVDPVAAGARAGLYRTASRYAARFCRRVAGRLENTARSASRELLAELRRFYRFGNARKLRHIERFA